MNNEMIKVLVPQVASTAFGKKMFKKVHSLIEQDASIQEIRKNLSYHPSASGAQQMVFNYLKGLDKISLLKIVSQ